MDNTRRRAYDVMAQQHDPAGAGGRGVPACDTGRKMEQRTVYVRGGTPVRRKRKNMRVPLFLLVCAVALGFLLLQGFKLLTPETPTVGDVPNTENGALQGYVPDERIVVVVDAGHGGKDPGAQNAAGTINESDIVQPMAEKLAALLGQNADRIQVVFTHEEGVYLTPAQRAEAANSVNADLFVSLHLNSDTSAGVRGFQVFSQTPNQAHNAESVRLAGIMVEKMQQSVGLPVLGDTGVYYMFYEDPYTSMGYDINWPIPDYELSRDTYGVLQKTNCPAVLVEQWYLTNSEDMAKMNNEAGMNAMAQCLYESILEYLGL